MTPETFRKIRKKLGMTQTQLADRLKVSRISVTRWETGVLPIDERTKLAMEHLRMKLKIETH